MESLGLGAKLVKVWGSLRWSDLQAIIPGELSLVEGRLVTTLRRTKTSGSEPAGAGATGRYLRVRLFR